MTQTLFSLAPLKAQMMNILVPELNIDISFQNTENILITQWHGGCVFGLGNDDSFSSQCAWHGKKNPHYLLIHHLTHTYNNLYTEMATWPVYTMSQMKNTSFISNNQMISRWSVLGCIYRKPVSANSQDWHHNQECINIKKKVIMLVPKNPVSKKPKK